MMHMHLLGILGAQFSYEIADPLMKMGALMESPVTVISDVIAASRSEPHTSVFIISIYYTNLTVVRL